MYHSVYKIIQDIDICQAQVSQLSWQSALQAGGRKIWSQSLFFLILWYKLGQGFLL